MFISSRKQIKKAFVIVKTTYFNKFASLILEKKMRIKPKQIAYRLVYFVKHYSAS